MLIFDPERLAQWSGGKWHGNVPIDITGFCIDARKMESGKVFVALKAERDGHDFLEQAVESGASAALVSKLILNIDLPQLVVDDTLRAFQSIAANYRKEFTIPVVGITGSCGKTSTKEFLSLLLGDTAHKTAKNLNNYQRSVYSTLSIFNTLDEPSMGYIFFNATLYINVRLSFLNS